MASQETATAPRQFAPKIEWYDVAKLKTLDRNPRLHSDEQLDEIGRSIETYGFVVPVLVDERNGVVVCGNGRLAAARRIGLERVPGIPISHLSEGELLSLTIADNVIATHASWDRQILGEYLTELERLGVDTSGTFLSEEEIDAIISQFEDENATVEEDDAPALPDAATTQQGDVWILGENHRVVCGSATDPAAWDALCKGGELRAMVTDPPYGVLYADKNEFLNRIDKGNRIQIPIEQDDLEPEALHRLLVDAFKLAASRLAQGSTFYVTAPGGPNLETFLSAVNDSGLRLAAALVWVKNVHVLSRADFNFKHEMVVYGWNPGAAHRFYGQSEVSVWEIDRPFCNDLHPTMKPVSVYAKAIELSTLRGEFVVDPFAGSGTLVIACEQLERKARMIEIDERYCDTIVRRWENYTGEQATLEASGASFDDVVAERGGG